VSRVDWVEVARDVFVGAYEPLTINICVIRDRDRLVLVDSRASATEGAQLAADLTWFAPAQVQALINTHTSTTRSATSTSATARRRPCRSTAITCCQRISTSTSVLG
jgi:hypothetical protein